MGLSSYSLSIRKRWGCIWADNPVQVYFLDNYQPNLRDLSASWKPYPLYLLKLFYRGKSICSATRLLLLIFSKAKRKCSISWPFIFKAYRLLSQRKVFIISVKWTWTCWFVNVIGSVLQYKAAVRNITTKGMTFQASQFSSCIFDFVSAQQWREKRAIGGFIQMIFKFVTHISGLDVPRATVCLILKNANSSCCVIGWCQYFNMLCLHSHTNKLGRLSLVQTNILA